MARRNPSKAPINASTIVLLLNDRAPLPANQKTAIRHSYGPENYATTAHGAHLSISNTATLLPWRAEDF
jgi:hypothetical protein